MGILLMFGSCRFGICFNNEYLLQEPFLIRIAEDVVIYQQVGKNAALNMLRRCCSFCGAGAEFAPKTHHPKGHRRSSVHSGRMNMTGTNYRQQATGSKLHILRFWPIA
jgi:hypothetical protein